MGWEWKKLRDISVINSGYGFPIEFQEESHGDIPFFKVMDISKNFLKNEKYLDKSDFYISYENFKKINGSFFKKGTIVFAKIGAALLLNRRAILNCDSVVDNNIIGVTANLDYLDNLFLFYFLSAVDMANYCRTTSVPSLRKSDIENICIPLPPLPVQRRIVEILDRADALRRYRTQADAETQKLLQSVFYEMFGDPVRNEKGWERRKLGDICVRIFGGGTPPTSNTEYFNGNIPWVSPKDMKEDFILDSIDHISEKALSESSTQIAPKNSLLMVIRSGILKRKLPVTINLREVAINQDMKAFVFKEGVVSPFYMLFFFKLYQNVLLQRVRSVTADNLEFNQIKELKIPIPPWTLQQYYISIVNDLEKISKKQERSRKEIEILFDGLLEMSFRGDLEGIYKYSAFPMKGENQ